MSARRAHCLPVVYITRELLQTTGTLLSSFARHRQAEGVVYWFGLSFGDDRAVVTTLIVPDADTSTGAVRTSVEANAGAFMIAIGTPLVLLGQAHSHPGRAVGHSRTDDREAFARFEGAISVVVPSFARHGIALRTCGLHRYVDGRFRRIRRAEMAGHLIVLPGIADLRPQMTS